MLYRFELDITQLELEARIRAHGYPLGKGLVSKYEHGTRRPPAAFIYYAAQSLSLTQEQVSALFDAYAADVSRKLLTEYASVLKNAAKRRGKG